MRRVGGGLGKAGFTSTPIVQCPDWSQRFYAVKARKDEVGAKGSSSPIVSRSATKTKKWHEGHTMPCCLGVV